MGKENSSVEKWKNSYPAPLSTLQASSIKQFQAEEVENISSLMLNWA